MNSIDLACTALAVGGVNLGTRQLEGKNLIPHWRGEASQAPHEALFWRKEGGEAWAVRAGTWKLIGATRGNRRELYDLAADPSEQLNLAEQQPAEVERLQRLYEEWNRDNQPPFFPSYPDYHSLTDDHYREISRGPEDES